MSAAEFVRLRCADYGDEWVVEYDVFSAEDDKPVTAGPYSFSTEQVAKRFVETSLRAVEPTS